MIKLKLDIEMPKCCADCLLNYDCCYCSVTGTNIIDCLNESRADDCPLIQMDEVTNDNGN